MKIITVLSISVICLWFMPLRAQQKNLALGKSISESTVDPSFTNYLVTQSTPKLVMNLLDSVHYLTYFYDSIHQIVDIRYSWTYHQYDNNGDLKHTFFAEFPSFYNASRISYSYNKPALLTSERSYKTVSTSQIHPYPHAPLINSLLNMTPQYREDVYRNVTNNKIDSVVHWSYQSENDSIAYKMEFYKYNPDSSVQSSATRYLHDFGNGMQWYMKSEEYYHYDQYGRDTLHYIVNDSNSVDSILYPFSNERTRYFDSVHIAVRSYEEFNPVDQVFVTTRLDSIRFDSVGGHMIECKSYVQNVALNHWSLESTKYFKMMKFSYLDTLMEYRVLGNDTVYGDNYTFTFNVHNQLVSVLGWGEDLDLGVFYKRIEYKYIYNQDGTISDLLQFSYPIPYENTLVLDGHYKFFYSLHMLGIDPLKPNLQEAKLFPNPGNGMIELISERRVEEVEVYNSTGRLLLNKVILNEETKVDFSALASGLYIILIRYSDGTSENLKYILSN